jgi:hypothetical protein
MPDHIVIGDIRPRVQYTADGTQAVFTYPFPIFAAADLKVYLGETLQSTGFTVAGAGQSAGGSVTFAPAPAAGTRVTLVRALAIARNSDFQEGGAFRAKTLNDELDRQTAFIQEVGERIERAIVAAPTESAAPLVLPPPAQRANALLGFDAAGTPIASGGSGSVPISPALTPVVQAASVSAAKDLLGVAYKNAVVDFGAVGDDATNNDAAAAAIVVWINANGGIVFWPRGIYRFDSPIPTITGKSGGFIGAGSGMNYNTQNAGPATGGSYGTVFRRNFAASDLITIGTTAEGVTVRDIGFWPVPFTTAGYELHDRGLDTLIENVHAAYCYGVILAGGGSNGSTYRHIRAIGVFGEGGITTRGSGPSIENWAQGLTIDDFEYYNPLLQTPSALQHKGSWSTGLSISQYDTVIANGRLWQASNSGNTAAAGSGPVTPSYPFAGAPTTQYVNDNGIQWRMIGSATGANVLVDSNSVVVNIVNSLLVGAGMWGIYFANTLGSGIVPQSVKVANTLIDTTIGDGIFLNYGYEVTLENVDCRWSISGRGLSGAANFGGNLNVSGGQFWNNALDGILLPPMADVNATLVGLRCVANGVKAANTYSGISVAAGTTKFQVLCCQLGADPAGAGTQKYGLDLGAGCLNYVVKGNIALGNGTAGYSTSAARNVATEIFTGNTGTVAGLTGDSEGSWVPALTFATPGNLNVLYSHQAGRYIIKDGWCTAEFSIQTSTFTHSTAGGALRITGLPVSHISVTGLIPSYGLQWSGITKAGYTSVTANLQGATNIIDFWASGSGQNVSPVAAADCPSGGSMTLRGVVVFRVA